jgi:hypothetical protein
MGTSTRASSDAAVSISLSTGSPSVAAMSRASRVGEASSPSRPAKACSSWALSGTGDPEAESGPAKPLRHVPRSSTNGQRIPLCVFQDLLRTSPVQLWGRDQEGLRRSTFFDSESRQQGVALGRTRRSWKRFSKLHPAAPR